MWLLVKSLFLNFRIVDAIDIIFLSLIFYWILNIIKGTRALYMLFALGLAIVAIWLSEVFKIHSINWIFTSFFDNLPLIIIVLFQNELRRALTQLGKQPFSAKVHMNTGVIEELVKTCFSLANQKIGALMLIENESDISDFLESGHVIDATVSRELILSIFMPSSPVHDGAMTIRNNRITRAGCFLPLTLNPKISKHLGTRHRAAIGITELVDVLAIVVSEETGQISAAKGGKIFGNLDAVNLRKLLTNAYTPRKGGRKETEQWERDLRHSRVADEDE